MSSPAGANNASLRPAWRSGGRGFQPPPTVASERSHNRTASASSSSGKSGSAVAAASSGEKNASSSSPTATQNKFSALDNDDDDVLELPAATSTTTTTTTSTFTTATTSYASMAAAVASASQAQQQQAQQQQQQQQPPAPATRTAPSNSRSEGFRQGLAARQEKQHQSTSAAAAAAATTSTTTTTRNTTASSSGRSLADLAARVPERSSSFGQNAHHHGQRFSNLRGTSGVGGVGAPASSGGTAAGVGGGASASSVHTVDPDAGKNIIRYTRERLLSMRPSAANIGEYPTLLLEMQGSPILADEPQDPVCWDAFDAQEIWANVPHTIAAANAGIAGIATATQQPRGRLTKTTSIGGRDVILEEGGLPAGSTGGVPTRRVSATTSSGPPGRRDSASSGRWMRGVALPPPSSVEKQAAAAGGVGGGGGGGRSNREADNPNDLWDDPMASGGGALGGAALDFSAFTMPDDDDDDDNGVSPATDDVFDFEKMAAQSRLLEEEMHGTTRRTRNNSSGGDDLKPTTTTTTTTGSLGDAADVDEDGQAQIIRTIDPQRPLASIGTTIRSGSGDDVNVFEDFDEPDATNSATADTIAVDNTEKKMGGGGADSTMIIKSAAENPSASSRLMTLIGVNNDPPAPENAASGSIGPSNHSTPSTHVDGGMAIPSPSGSEGLAIPLNPWGGPLLPSMQAPGGGGGGGEPSAQGLDLRARLRQAEMEQKARERVAAEEMMRRQQEMEAQKQRAQQLQLQQQQAALLQQQQQQQQGVQSQVELVLIERISTILENSWGRADLMTVLQTLHSEDPRVAPLLNNVDALRALIMRNPRRVAVRHDPAYNSEVAVLVIPNAQWQQQQQQQQQAQAARAQQEELHRREQQRRLEEQKAAAVRAQQQQQALAAAAAPVPGAPWYYSDPQRNIQGPFRGEEMRQWLEAGYFKGDLPISQEPTGPFRQLSTIFPDLSAAFMFPNAEHEKAEKEAAAARARAAAEHEEKERMLRAEVARQQAAAEEAARERLAREAAEAQERERAAQEAAAVAAEEERRAKEAAAAGSGNNSKKKKKNSDNNASSDQLKMMLGLSAQGGVAGGGGEAASTESGQMDSKQAERAASKRQSKATKNNAQQNQAAAAAAEFLEQSQSVARSTSTGNAAPAWGGAAKPASRKSMSEIQQEEARIAAIQASQRKGGSQSSGWANVASKGTPAATVAPAPGWSGGGTVKPTMANVAVAATPTAIQTRRPSTGNISTTAALNKQAGGGPGSKAGQTAANSVVEDFGAKMSPALEKWSKEQMVKINGTDDLTLVGFCMTLQDPVEIRQYLTTYLGSTPQVNSFATEFISRKMGKPMQEEWETTAATKKKGKKKTGK
jgi:GYF domain